MLKISLRKQIDGIEQGYYIYIGVLETISGLKLTEQEKKVFCNILKNKKIERKELNGISSPARIENIISKLRKKKFLINDKPNPRFINIDSENFELTLKIDGRVK
jgi:hypothetical protein